MSVLLKTVLKGSLYYKSNRLISWINKHLKCLCLVLKCIEQTVKHVMNVYEILNKN